MHAITSGRYDPPHLGHYCNIKKIARTAGVESLVVYVLDYEERRFPLSYCLAVLCEALIDDFPTIQIVTNKTHFAKIKPCELAAMKFDVYCGGNHEVLKHIESMGFRTAYFERSFDFEASKYPGPVDKKKIINKPNIY